MDINTAIKGVLKTEEGLRSREGIMNPVFMSEAMMRLSQYTGAVEERLAEYEKEAELESARRYKYYLVEMKYAATKAEKFVKIDIAETKAQVTYLSRIVASAWRQVGVIQSRINHLVRESQTTST